MGGCEFLCSGSGVIVCAVIQMGGACSPPDVCKHFPQTYCVGLNFSPLLLLPPPPPPTLNILPVLPLMADDPPTAGAITRRRGFG